MNFTTGSLHSIAYCECVLINMHYTSVAGQNSSAGRKKAHIYWGLTRCQGRYLCCTDHSSPETSKAGSVITHISCDGCHRGSVFCRGARIEKRLCGTPQSMPAIPPTPISILYCFGNRASKSEFPSEMPSSSFSSHVVWVSGSTALNLGVGFSKMTDQDWAHDSSWSNERCYYRFGETLEISEPRLFCPRCYLPKSACNGSAPSRLPLGEGDGQPHDLSIISLTSTPYRYLDIILPSVSLLAPHTIPHNTAGWGFHGISPTTFFPWPSPYVSSIVPWF